MFWRLMLVLFIIYVVCRFFEWIFKTMDENN
jgi:hypothetical protein